MKHFLIILLSLLPLFSNSQTKQKVPINYDQAVFHSNEYNEIQQGEDAGNDKGSFGIVITTNNTKESDGYYYYDIFLNSNSHYKDGVAAKTYITYIDIFVLENGYWRNVISFDYALLKSHSEWFHLAYVYNTVKVTQIKVVWKEVTPL